MRRSHNDVDIAQRTAGPVGPREDENESFMMKWLKEMYPWGFQFPGNGSIPPYHHVWGDPESEEKLREILRDDGKSTEERAEEQRIGDEQEDPLGKEAIEKWNREKTSMRRKDD